MNRSWEELNREIRPMLIEETGSGGVVMRDPKTDIEKFAALHGWTVERAALFIARVIADEADRVDMEGVL